MERILTSDAMRRADKYTIEKLGIPKDVLIERAGVAVAEEILKRFKGGRVLVAIGKGNNGEDGKIIANMLAKKHGFAVSCYDVYNDDISFLDKDVDIIIDCIFGTGLNRNIEGKLAEIINKINKKGCYVIACDIASGLNSDTGLPMNVCVKANLTIAIQEYKTGHFLNDGKYYSGEVVACDIGISIWDEKFAYRLRRKDVAKYFPHRFDNTNKGDYGKAGVIGGSKEFFGAPLLSQSALSALLAGAGYGYLFVPESLYPIYAGLNPECILGTLLDDGNTFIDDKSVLGKIKGLDCVVFGMGASMSESVYELLKTIITGYDGKLIIDADGLNVLAKFGLDVLKDKKCQILLTPHVKEFSRLHNVSTEEVITNSIELAKAFAQKYGVTVALKSSTTVITDGDRVCINITGNASLAKAGSGDVLAGLISGVATKLDLFDATCVGAYIFGIAGEIASAEHSEYSVVASILPQYIGRAIKSL